MSPPQAVAALVDGDETHVDMIEAGLLEAGTKTHGACIQYAKDGADVGYIISAIRSWPPASVFSAAASAFPGWELRSKRSVGSQEYGGKQGVPQLHVWTYGPPKEKAEQA